MWRRRARPTPTHESRRFDVRDRKALEASLALVGPETTSVTVYMCWHGGTGHDYPADVMEAAWRLRERHSVGSGSDDDYTSLTFMPSEDDLSDFVLVAPYCDLAYATNANDEVLLEVSGEGASWTMWSRQDEERHGR